MTVEVHTFSPPLVLSEVTVTTTVALLPNSFFFFRIFVVSKNLMIMAERIEDDKIENEANRRDGSRWGL